MAFLLGQPRGLATLPAFPLGSHTCARMNTHKHTHTFPLSNTHWERVWERSVCGIPKYTVVYPNISPFLFCFSFCFDLSAHNYSAVHWEGGWVFSPDKPWCCQKVSGRRKLVWFDLILCTRWYMNIVSCDKIISSSLSSELLFLFFQNISCIFQQMFMYMEKVLTHDFILWWTFLFYANGLLDFSWLSTDSFLWLCSSWSEPDRTDGLRATFGEVNMFLNFLGIGHIETNLLTMKMQSTIGQLFLSVVPNQCIDPVSQCFAEVGRK